MTELPNNSYFSGGIVDILEDIFGPSLYLRFGGPCSYFFAIPLPFSIRSVAYLDGNFFTIRDDDGFHNSTLYSIADYDLFGGYVFWLSEVEQQCQSCNNSQLIPTVELNKQKKNCTASVHLVNQSICSADLDTNFAQERITLPIDLVLANGQKYFQKLLHKFLLVHSKLDSENLQKKAWYWTLWNRHDTISQRLTRVHSTPYINSLIVNQPDFVVLQIKNALSSPVVAELYSDGFKLITIASYMYGDRLFVVGIDITGILHLVDVESGKRMKVGTLPSFFHQIFILSNSILVGLDASNTMFISHDFVSDILLPNIPCAPSAMKSSGCEFHINLGSPFTKQIAKNACASFEGSYTKSEDWFTFKNGHQYFVMREFVTHHEALERCSQLGGQGDAGRLAMLEDKELLKEMKEYITNTTL
ncbi:uncharacterized protein LOC143464504 [Clavelina lepadiformis]|uniref:uncharacterized protein LOC143464504 n=1 Tax=Clavelina lepadiformis TaxID=159417 RepID=UPI0040438160